MPLQSKKERDRLQSGSTAEGWRHSKENKMPRIQEKYWANPNSQRGEIVRCSYYLDGKEHEVRVYDEGN